MDVPTLTVPGPRGSVLHPDSPPAWLAELSATQLFAWAWQSVNLAFSAQADELRDTGLRIPLRGLMLFAWDWGVRERSMHGSHLETLLRDTGRLGTRGECSADLKDAILALHYLGRAGMVVQGLSPDDSAAWAHFVENLMLSLQRAVLAHPFNAVDAVRRLRELLEG